MAHTNETTNLQLPQFVASDKPTWLGDVNGAMAKIDASYGTVQAEATGAGATAQQALAAANGAVQTANTALSTAGTSSTSASEALSLANNALTVANNTATLAGQIVEDMGSLSDLDTTDKSSIVGAINEIAQGGGGGTPTDVSAEDVTYSNTTSGLTATNVQAAIDELADKPAPESGYEYVLLKSVTPDGTKSLKDILNELATVVLGLTPEQEMRTRIRLKGSNLFYPNGYVRHYFQLCSNTSNNPIGAHMIELHSTNSLYLSGSFGSNTTTDESANVPNANTSPYELWILGGL